MLEKEHYRIRENNGFRWLAFPPLERIAGIEHGFTTKPFSSQSYRRAELLNELRTRTGLNADKFALTDQVHSGTVRVAEEEGRYRQSDGLLTAIPGLALGAFSADCLLIYLVDPPHAVVGLLHAGRKGTGEKIAENAVRLLASRFGSEPQSCIAVFSPAIGPCCYEMDLEEENARQLSGLGFTTIVRCRTCTGCHPELFYSYRKGEKKNWMLGWIAVKRQW